MTMYGWSHDMTQDERGDAPVLRCFDCHEAMTEGGCVSAVDEIAGEVDVCRDCANDRRAE